RAGVALGVAHALDLADALLQLLHALADHAAVQLDLLLARAARLAERAALALEVGPAAHQARGEVLEARELDLELALVGTRALREDVEDEVGAIVDRHGGIALGERALEVADLRGGQRIVEDHDVRAVLDGRRLDLLDLSGARERRRIRAVATPANDVRHPDARALDQARGFPGPVLGLGAATDVEGYKDRAGALRIPASGQSGQTQDARERPWRWRACTPSASPCS